MPEFNRRLKDFEKFNAVVLGACTDSVPSHEAWVDSIGGIEYPLLSDYNKQVSRDYGVLMEKEGIALPQTKKGAAATSLPAKAGGTDAE